MNFRTRPKSISMNKISELLTSKWFCENISKLITSWNVACLYETRFIRITDKPVLDVNVLCVLIYVPILDHVDSRLIVNEKGSRECRSEVNGIEYIAKPNSLLTSQGSGYKFCFSATECNSSLFLGTPRYCGTGKKRNVARNGLVINAITRPVRVCIDSRLGRANISVVDKYVVRSTTQVSENAIDCIEMNLTRF